MKFSKTFVLTGMFFILLAACGPGEQVTETNADDQSGQIQILPSPTATETLPPTATATLPPTATSTASLEAICGSTFYRSIYESGGKTFFTLYCGIGNGLTRQNVTVTIDGKTAIYNVDYFLSDSSDEGRDNDTVRVVTTEGTHKVKITSPYGIKSLEFTNVKPGDDKKNLRTQMIRQNPILTLTMMRSLPTTMGSKNKLPNPFVEAARLDDAERHDKEDASGDGR